MIVAIHQPHFLPWLGYLDRMRRADLFISLDHVQFERRGHQNRTHILLDGLPHWLTVPVLQHSRQERIVDKQIDNSSKDVLHSWGGKHFQTLQHAYRHAPFFENYAPSLRPILESRWERLVDLNQALLDFLRDALDIHTPLIRSSSLQVEGHRSDLILNLCLAVGADTLLAGMGGSVRYLDREAFADAGVRIVWQDFQHPEYPQCETDTFVPGLSAIDLLFNNGPKGVGILQGNATELRIPDFA